MDLQCAKVTTLRNEPDVDYLALYGKVRGKFMARVHAHVLNKFEARVACSPGVAEWLNDQGLNSVTVLNGVDTDEYCPVGEAERAILKERLGFSPSARVAVWVGALHERKDPDTALEAFDLLEASNWQLAIVGDGPLRDAVEKKVNAQGRDAVMWVGHQRNVVPWLQCADVFISTSRAEGLPNSVLEALACDVPVVLSDIMPHRYVLERTQGVGELAAVGDAGEAAKAWKMVGEYQMEAGKRRKVAVSAFSSKATADQYMELYQKLATK